MKDLVDIFESAELAEIRENEEEGLPPSSFSTIETED